MPAKRSPDPSNVVRWLFDRGEEAAGQIIHELFGRVGASGSRSRSGGRRPKPGAEADKNLDAILHLLNLPSRTDLNKLQAKIDLLQGSLTNLNIKLDRLLAAQAQARPRMPVAPPHDLDSDD